MFQMPRDYIERCYAGWLGKLIGVRYGAPIEGWTYEQIRQVYGELDGYVVDYRMFAADDDTNGPMLFIRALNDATYTRDLTPNQIAQAWLNYAPYEHGFYWWGGYGRSTEHTAYLNLRAGIPAPRSGSVAQNGATIAEQIGGQIFIDTWGLVLPGRPELAAEYAAKAASVSHGGNGIYGGQFVAAAISAAFTAKSVGEILDTALSCIPADCEYARMTRDVRAVCEKNPSDWRAAFEHVRGQWGYDRYPGTCHIIPNAAVMVLSLVCGGGDFDRTLNICNMCGWDTDCNVGNIGTIMGVFCGLEAIDDKKWRAPINDFFAVSSVLGCLNAMDAPWCVGYLADLAYRMAGEPMPEHWAKALNPSERRYTFALPGSTCGFRVEGEDIPGFEGDCVNGGDSLKARVDHLAPTQAFRIGKRTYFHPDDFHDNRYDPAFSPLVYPGQTISVRLRRGEAAPKELYASIYVRDRNSGKTWEGARVRVPESGALELSEQIPSMPHMLIDDVGVRIVVGCESWGAAVVLLEELRVDGKAKYDIDFAHERMECYTGMHREVSQFTYLKGNWDLDGGRLSGSTCDYGELYTGDLSWTDYALEGTVICPEAGEAGLNVRVQGAIRSYAVTLGGGLLRIRKNANGYATLAERPHETKPGQTVRLRIQAQGAKISVFENGEKLLEIEDADAPYLNGCIGCSLMDGAHAWFEKLVID